MQDANWLESFMDHCLQMGDLDTYNAGLAALYTGDEDLIDDLLQQYRICTIAWSVDSVH